MNTDKDEMLDNMTRVTQANDETGRLTLYAVVCFEHGGLIVSSAAEALEAMDPLSEGPGTCVYRALAISLDPNRMPTFPGEGEVPA